MKKIICLLLCLLMTSSVFLTAVLADESAGSDTEPGIKTETFDALPEGSSEKVTLVPDTSLRMSMPGKTDTFNISYKGYIPLSYDLIEEDATVTLYARIDWVKAWNNGLALGLTDDSFNPIKTVMTSVILHPNNGISFLPADGNLGTVYTPTDICTSGEWVRIDILVNQTENKAAFYADYKLIGEAGFYKSYMTGFKGIQLHNMGFGSPNGPASYYLDDIMVRSGMHVPEEGDLATCNDPAVLAAAEDLIVFEPFDKMPLECTIVDTGTSKNLDDVTNYMSHCNTVGHTENKYLMVTSPETEEGMCALVPLKGQSVSESATATFYARPAFVGSSHPGLRIKLADADGKIVGGFAIGGDNTVLYDDGTHVFADEKAKVKLGAGLWHRVDLLINKAGKSVTVYIDGERLGSVASEGEGSIEALLLIKYEETAKRAMSWCFDNVTLRKGLYVPGSDNALSEDDALVTVDRVYQAPPAVDDPEEEDTKASTSEVTTPGNTDTRNTEQTVTDPQTAEKGGCASSVSGGIWILCVLGLFGLAFRRKQVSENS